MRKPTPTPLLTAAEECSLARTIEAGVLAGHLLANGERPLPATGAELGALVEAGRRAWHRFLLANVRLVWKLAGRESRRSGLSVDELFQEGFVALADALQRYDPDRGRFSTFATIRVRQRLAEIGAARLGGFALPPGRALLMRRARGLEAALGQERGGAVGTAELAAELGRPVHSTGRLLRYRAPVGLDDVGGGLAIPEANPVDVDQVVYVQQFRRLLGRLDPDQVRVIGLRYGFATGEPLEVTDVASRLGVSASTVRRLERRAMVALRPLAAALDPCAEGRLAG